MRMVRGGSVEAMVGPGRPLEMKQALSILGDVAAALDYAHAQGVVHRDIKPANVLLGDSGHAMVADFGIARAVSGPGGGSTATGTGVVGSPAYMSPEQWRGEKVDGRADQYALGVLAFELFTGSRPFKGNSMQELLRMHLSEDAPDIISVRHDLPSHLTDTIRRALAKDPGDRFPSSAAFVAALGGAPAPSKRAAAAPPISSAPTVRTPMPPVPVAAASGGPGGKTVAKGVKLTDESQKIPVGAGAGGESREKRSLVPWLALLLIAGAGAAVIWKLAPERGSKAATPTELAVVDSMGDLEKRLQAQVDEMRRIAMAAERRADSIAAANSSNRGGGAPAGGVAQSPAPKEDPHAHVYVFAQGGTPQVYVDGVSQNTNAPAVFQLTPGKHVVSVRGGQEFAPAETTIVLAAEDTQTVVFRVSRTVGVQQQNFPNARAGQQFRNAGTPGPNAVPAPSGTNAPANVNESILTPGPNGQPLVNWPAVTRKLGFDPRNVDQRTLTPLQRQNFRKFQYMLDSLRRAGAAGGLRKP
jgi:hypothetical protein